MDAEATFYERHLTTIFIVLVAMLVLAVFAQGYFTLCARLLATVAALG